jgi:hypothetical protein
MGSKMEGEFKIKIAPGKSPSEFGAQDFSQAFQHFLPIGGSFFPSLFVFHDPLADGEIHGHLGGIDAAGGQRAGRSYYLPYLLYEVGGLGV